MRFAHFAQPMGKPGMPMDQRYEQQWRELELCDELGFEYGFQSEHHFERTMPSPAMYCTAGAARTRRIRLGAMGYTVPLYDPLRIAEDAAVLDNIMNGRLEIGLVSGILPIYFQVWNVDWDNRTEVTNEAVLLLKKAFTTDGPFSFDGPFHHYQDLNLAVKPLQKPHPPMWLMSRTPETLAMLAREGVHTGYLFLFPRDQLAPVYREYLRLWRQAGHRGNPNISYTTFIHVDETDEAALSTAKEAMLACRLYERPFQEQLPRPGKVTEYEVRTNVTDVDFLHKHNLMFVGSPQSVLTQIRDAAEEGFFNTLFCEFNFGTLEDENLMRSIRLFGTQVMPALREFDPTMSTAVRAGG